MAEITQVDKLIKKDRLEKMGQMSRKEAFRILYARINESLSELCALPGAKMWAKDMPMGAKWVVYFERHVDPRTVRAALARTNDWLRTPGVAELLDSRWGAAPQIEKADRVNLVEHMAWSNRIRTLEDAVRYGLKIDPTQTREALIGRLGRSVDQGRRLLADLLAENPRRSTLVRVPSWSVVAYLYNGDEFRSVNLGNGLVVIPDGGGLQLFEPQPGRVRRGRAKREPVPGLENVFWSDKPVPAPDVSK